VDTKQKLGIVIRKLRMDKSISQENLALQADIDRTYISDIEKGERNISVEILEKLANTLEISISDLFKQVENYGKQCK
jgi:transcriptional regulator with XRE-family HTH domain